MAKHSSNLATLKQHDGLPLFEARRADKRIVTCNGQPEWNIEFLCPHCKRWHQHEWPIDAPLGVPSHRVAHCNNDSPFHEWGYYIALNAPLNPKDLEGKLLSSAEVRQHLASRGIRRKSPGATVKRWAVEGRNGVLLQSVKTHEGWLRTTQAWLDEFLIAAGMWNPQGESTTPEA